MIGENNNHIQGLLQTSRDALSQSRLEATQGTFKGLLNASKGAEDLTKIESVAKDFEAVFITQLIQQLNEGNEPDPLFGGGNAEATFRDLLFNEYGKSIAGNGGFGLSAQIQKELLKLQEV